MDFIPMLIYASVSYITPGPNNIMSMYLGANYGFGGSKRFIIGSSLSHFVKACLCGGLNVALAQTVPSIMPYIKWIGVAYLIYLTVHILLDGFKKDKKESSVSGGSSTYKSGIMLQILNVKSWISCLSVFSIYVVPYTTAFSQIALAVAVIQLLMTGSTIIWVVFGGALKSFYAKHVKLFSIIMAALLLWCAITAI